MIRPVNFGFNPETAENNAFQVKSESADVQADAAREFDEFVSLLRANDVDVMVVEDTPEPHTPDSLFPNNWISFHSDGTLLLYPMYAESRRAERKAHVLEKIQDKFRIAHEIDLSSYERNGQFLEGTGSMVLDRDHRVAYACLSPRTDQKVLNDFCRKMNYQPVTFNSLDSKGQAIYHTNVMMCVADKYVVICMESIPDKIEKERVTNSIREMGKKIIEISYDQLNHFAGNMLQIENSNGEKLLVMSAQAYHSLTESQLTELTGYNSIIYSPLNTIELNGGGSARCMMAEIHLPVLT